MASEDQRFLQHHGFDVVEIQNAVEERMAGKRRRGGSTISQQTAKKRVFMADFLLGQKRTGAYFTALIELCWSKQRIMEVYLNSIEMGDGIYGAEAVAQQHFGRPAEKLTRANCALIAATLPNPLKYSSKNPSRYMLKRQTAINAADETYRPVQMTRTTALLIGRVFFMYSLNVMDSKTTFLWILEALSR